MIKKYTFLLAVAILFSMAIACSGEENEFVPNETNDSNLVDEATDTKEDNINANTMHIKVGDTTLTVALVDNSSVDALVNALSEAPITINMRDYGNMEKVGSLGRDFPRNDEPITTEAGDVILFQGSALVIYYAPNSWTFTRLGKIENITQEKLKNVLGDGNVTVTLSLPGD